MYKYRSLWIVVPLTLLAAMVTAFAPLPAAGSLSEAEAEGLAYMREEEKLAHDLYLELYDQYGLPVFANIARSEAAHMDAVLSLLETYGLADPAQGMPAGKFTDPALQALYDDLLARGKQSLEEALCVAALVEETDILDLQARLAQTTRADITHTYQNLLQASGSHLRAFVLQVERQTGETYALQVLSASEYTALTTSPQPATRSGTGMRGSGRGHRPW